MKKHLPWLLNITLFLGVVGLFLFSTGCATGGGSDRPAMMIERTQVHNEQGEVLSEKTMLNGVEVADGDLGSEMVATGLHFLNQETRWADGGFLTPPANEYGYALLHNATVFRTYQAEMDLWNDSWIHINDPSGNEIVNFNPFPRPVLRMDLIYHPQSRAQRWGFTPGHGLAALGGIGAYDLSRRGQKNQHSMNMQNLNAQQQSFSDGFEAGSAAVTTIRVAVGRK